MTCAVKPDMTGCMAKGNIYIQVQRAALCKLPITLMRCFYMQTKCSSITYSGIKTLQSKIALLESRVSDGSRKVLAFFRKQKRGNRDVNASSHASLALNGWPRVLYCVHSGRRLSIYMDRRSISHEGIAFTALLQAPQETTTFRRSAGVTGLDGLTCSKTFEACQPSSPPAACE